MSFVSLQTGYTGLIASQVGIETASHNISNSGTDGYTRQRIDSTSRLPRLTNAGYVGTGVEVTDVRRARDEFLDARVRTGQTVLGSMVANSGLMKRAEAVLGEPDNGITVELDAVFAAFEELALNPDDHPSRITAISSLDSLASRIRRVAAGFNALEQDTATNLGLELTEVNDLLAQVADLNGAIIEASATSATPNDLLDQRDLALDSLAHKIGVSITPLTDGSVRVSLGGLSLVDGVNSSALSLDVTTFDVVHPTGRSVPPGGEIGGIQSFLQMGLPTAVAELNAFAIDLQTSFNTQHAAGFYDDTNNGAALFGSTAGVEAETLTLTMTDPDQLAASDSGGTPFPSFNGVNAQAIADLRTTVTALGGTATLGSALRTFVTNLGARTAAADRAATAQSELVGAAELAREAEHGVSLDEEMVLLVQFQRSYQAAARVITSADQALDTLINRTGIVGR